MALTTVERISINMLRTKNLRISGRSYTASSSKRKRIWISARAAAKSFSPSRVVRALMRSCGYATAARLGRLSRTASYSTTGSQNWLARWAFSYSAGTSSGEAEPLLSAAR